MVEQASPPRGESRRRGALAPRRLSAAFGLLAVSAAAATAAPVQAAVKISAFHVTPASTAAGAHANVTITTSFDYGSTSSDQVRDLAVTLPPGLLGNPTVTARCSQAAFAADSCPAATNVGTVSVVAALLGLLDTTSPGDVYSLEPTGSEPARLGIVTRPLPLGLGKIFITAPVDLNPATGALTTSITNLPQTVLGLPVRIDSMSLTLSGKVNNGAANFLTNPTSCNVATSTVSADSYGAPTTPSTASDSFTPTNCAALPFAPRVSATVTTTGHTGDSVALSSVVAQGPDESNVSKLVVTLPAAIASRQSTLFAACPAAQIAAGSCPAAATVGSISAITPLLTAPLAGPVQLQLNPPSLPLLIAQLNEGAIHLQLRDQTGLTPTGQLTNTFAGIPDVPVSQQTLTIAGGPSSLLIVGQCTGSQQLTAVITSQSGRTVTLTAPVKICTPGKHKVALKHKAKSKRHHKAKKRHRKTTRRRGH
jgi:hypothetical protein